MMTTRRTISRPRLLRSLVTVVALVACTLTLLAAGATAAAAAAQCIPAELPSGKAPKPTSFAEFLSPEVWTVTTYRAEVTAASATGPTAQVSEGKPTKIAATMYGRDGWIAQDINYLPDGKADRKIIYQRTADEGPNEGVIYYSGNNVILTRETIAVTIGDDGNAVVVRTLTSAGGDLLEVHTIAHDDHGWEVLHTVADAAGLVTQVITTVRREDGRPTLIEVRDGAGALVSKTTRAYNDAGELITETVWTPEEVIISTFESDIDHNWIVKRNYRVVPVEAAVGGQGATKQEPIDVIYREISAYG